jgi:hypothetical protein
MLLKPNWRYCIVVVDVDVDVVDVLVEVVDVEV